MSTGLKACPECGAETRRHPDRDTGKTIISYACKKGHFLSMDRKRGELISVAIPFKPLEACPKCGRTGLKVESEREFDSKDGISKLAVYRCPDGHTSPHRQLVVRQYNLPDWDGEDY